MERRTYGYARVSTKEQNTDRQEEKLKQYGIDTHDIYIDKISGKNFDRPEYQSMKRTIRKGDTLVITSIDRLGRNYDDIKTEWSELSKKADIIVLDSAELSTEGKGDLERKIICDVMLSLLSYVAEKERLNIRQRQQEGIAIAKKKDVKFGRPRIDRPSNWDEVYSDWTNKKITAVQAMKLLGLKQKTFYNMVNACQS